MGIAASIIAIAEAIKSVCVFLCTPQGQAALEDARKNTAALENKIALAGQWIEAQVKQVAEANKP